MRYCYYAPQRLGFTLEGIEREGELLLEMETAQQTLDQGFQQAHISLEQIKERLCSCLLYTSFGADYKTKSGTKRCEFYNEGFRRNNNIAPEFVEAVYKRQPS